MILTEADKRKALETAEIHDNVDTEKLFDLLEKRAGDTNGEWHPRIVYHATHSICAEMQRKKNLRSQMILWTDRK